jgi:DNA-binding transcriptional ArsR family regulator
MSLTAATSRLLKLLAHPMRTEILRVLEPGRVMSPKQIAAELDVPVETLTYHVRYLARLDAVELVTTAQRRGAVEHFYRATTRPFFTNEEWSDLSEVERAGITQAIALSMVQDIAIALETGSIDSRLDRHMTRSPLQLDDRAWTQLESQLVDTLELAETLQGESANRIAAGETTPVDARLMLLLFEAGTPEAQEPPPA